MRVRSDSLTYFLLGGRKQGDMRIKDYKRTHFLMLLLTKKEKRLITIIDRKTSCFCSSS